MLWMRGVHTQSETGAEAETETQRDRRQAETRTHGQTQRDNEKKGSPINGWSDSVHPKKHEKGKRNTCTE